MRSGERAGTRMARILYGASALLMLDGSILTFPIPVKVRELQRGSCSTPNNYGFSDCFEDLPTKRKLVLRSQALPEKRSANPTYSLQSMYGHR